MPEATQDNPLGGSKLNKHIIMSQCGGRNHSHSANYTRYELATTTDYTPPHTNTNAIADTGCTGHFLLVTTPSHNAQPTNDGICIQMPNKTSIQATHTCDLFILASPPPLAKELLSSHSWPMRYCPSDSYAIMDASQPLHLMLSPSIAMAASSSRATVILAPASGRSPWTPPGGCPSLPIPNANNTTLSPQPLSYFYAARPHHIPPCRIRLPRPILLDQGDIQRSLQHLAWPYFASSPQTSAQVHTGDEN
jgi:hypothetical protein